MYHDISVFQGQGRIIFFRCQPNEMIFRHEHRSELANTVFIMSPTFNHYRLQVNSKYGGIDEESVLKPSLSSSSLIERMFIPMHALLKEGLIRALVIKTSSDQTPSYLWPLPVKPLSCRL